MEELSSSIFDAAVAISGQYFESQATPAPAPAPAPLPAPAPISASSIQQYLPLLLLIGGAALVFRLVK